MVDRPTAPHKAVATRALAIPALFAAIVITFAPHASAAAGDEAKKKPHTMTQREAPVPPLPAPAEEFEKGGAEPALGRYRDASRIELQPSALPTVGGAWISQGPGPITGGQTEGITNGLVVGAIQTIVAHPTNADIVWVGAVNGGIWKTTNATNANPTWTAMGDGFSSLSIGAFQRDPTDGTHDTLVAGFGRFSSFSRVGGPRAGLLRTTNGGTNWTALTPALLSGKNISGLAARGATIVVSVNVADNYICGNIGVFRSTDSGGTFVKISGTAGLALGSAHDIASDPGNNAILYTATDDGGACGGTNGIYRSVDTGANWTKVSDAAMEALMADDSVLNNVRIAVGSAGQVYVGIMNNGRLAGLFRSATGAAPWTQLDTPSTNEGGTTYGIQPREKPGAQGSIHFSILADPNNANIVYVGGDRQPGNGDTGATFPNSIGAGNYTGRLFRVNASLAAGSQATPLTHCQAATAACNSTTSTTSNSAPHADSRRMVFDAAGNILEGDDGGVYRRTNPTGTGDWFSMNGNLRVTEAHDVAWDAVSNLIVSGNQDVGTSEQTSVGGTTWREVSQGDGGDVAIDDVSSATESTRYTSFQSLGLLRRRTLDVSGNVTATNFPALTVTGGGPAFVGQFATPVAVNAIDPTRVLFAGANDLYESADRGETIAALGFNRGAPAVVYGGRSGGVANAALIYAICTSYQDYPCTTLNAVWVRTAGTGAPVQTATSPGSSALRDIAVDPNDWQKAYVVNSTGQVFSTPNAGGTWTEITGNLGDGITDLRTIAFLPGSPNAIVVGGLNGVFRMTTTNAGVWNQFGSGLTAAPVWDLDFDAADDVLVAGTMGRGVWKLAPAANLGPLPTLSIGDVTVTEGNAGTTTATFTVSLSAAGGQVTVNYATADGTATSGVATIANPSLVSIPSNGNATPYPSTISVSGLTGTITKVTAAIKGYSHTYPADVDVLLVGPGGQRVVLMSDAGGSTDVSGLNLTFDDAAAAPLTAPALTSGTYQPTNLNDLEGGDDYPSPAPAGPHGSALSVFNTTSPNGTWSLYVVDDVTGDSGSLAEGWTLTITTTAGDYAPASGLLTIPAGSTSGTITVTVNGDAVNEPNETFLVNLSNAANATILDGQGQATITNDDGGSAPTNVVATATGTTSVDVTWTAAAGAASYRVYRGVRVAGNIVYTLVGSPDTNAFTDPTALAGTAYLYKVRSFSAGESGDSNIDLATTAAFTDTTLTTATPVKLAHFGDLLTAINAVRILAGLAPIAFTAPAPGPGVTVRRQHVLDLRQALDAARAGLVLGGLNYTDSTITAGATTIKLAHITDLRNGVK